MSRWFFWTKEDIARRRRQAEDRRTQKERARDCRAYMEIIPRALANCGIVHWTTSKETRGYSRRDLIRFVKAVYTPDTIYLQIDARSIPSPHSAADLHTPEVLETLCAACMRSVTWRNTAPENGIWYQIAVNGAIANIPPIFPFRDAIQARPEREPWTPLTFVVGVAENRRIIIDDLAKMPHLLVAGSTRTGKSTYLNSFLLQVLERSSPDAVRVLLVDLKSGAEMMPYRNVPHLWRYEAQRKVKDPDDPEKFTVETVTKRGIVKSPQDVIPALSAFEAEMIRRQRLLAKDKTYNIAGWNRKHPEDKWFYLVLIFDELATAIRNPDKKFARAVEMKLVNIMNIAAATGGQVILSTQRPSSDTVTGPIKANCEGRTAFSVPDQYASRVIIDTAHATNLEPAGRAIHLKGPRKIEIQTPKVTPKIIKRGIKQIIKKWGDHKTAPRSGSVTLDEILNYAIERLDGSLSRRQLYNAFHKRASRPEIMNLIDSINGKPLLVCGQVYKCVDKGSNIGRVLVPLSSLSLRTVDSGQLLKGNR